MTGARGDARWRRRMAGRGRRLRRALPVGAADRAWLSAALLPACVAVAVYLATNPYPAYGAGLYAQFASELLANGYAPPRRVPGYTADGVPFAYPPLQFYVYAALLDLGGDPVAIARFLPGVAVVAAQVPIYLLTRDHVGSRPGGAAAAALVALNPQVLEWHVSAGGVVRAFGFLYAMTAIYAGYRAFASGSRRAVLASALAFGLTVLTHPTYSLFVVATHLLFWGTLDRTVAGLGRGVAVAAGGAAVAGPWLAWALATHGPGTFLAAAGTHGGVGGGARAVTDVLSPLLLVPLGAGALLALRDRSPLLVWLVASVLLFEQPRFAFAVGAVAVAAGGVALARRARPLERRGVGVRGRAVCVALLLVAGTLVGGAHLAHEMTLVTDPSTPEFVDGEAMAAMDWAAAETDEDATFVVLGDAAEWFPALTGRTILVGPWGVEWRGAGAYDRQLDAYETVSACGSVACVETTAATVGARPDYVYVPKGRYTIRGENAVQFGTVERSFERSPGWERAHENAGVVVYRRVGAERAGSSDSSRRLDAAGPSPRSVPVRGVGRA